MIKPRLLVLTIASYFAERSANGRVLRLHVFLLINNV